MRQCYFAAHGTLAHLMYEEFRRGVRRMALYKDGSFLAKNNDDAFDTIHAAGTNAPNPGIYRCPGCGHEIATAMNHTLPPQNHHQHTTAQGKVRWQLIVSHKTYPKN